MSATLHPTTLTRSLTFVSLIMLSFLLLSRTVAATSFASRQATPLMCHSATGPAIVTRKGRRRHSSLSSSAKSSWLENSSSSLASRSSPPSISFCAVVNPRTKNQPNSSNSNAKKLSRQRSQSQSSSSSSNNNINNNNNSLLYFVKVGMAGGIAGAVGSAILYPMDAAKTLRQSSPSKFSSVFQALGTLIFTTQTSAINGSPRRTWHVQKVYRGVIPGTLGAIPSSALYFGAYETMKSVLTRYFPLVDDNSNSNNNSSNNSNFTNRLLVHSLAAMSGNILSSAVFVPKELIKQQLQYRQSGNVLGVMVDILKTKGVPGFYVGYKATLMRNIPTAVLRFSLYEEFRYRWYTKIQQQQQQKGGSTTTKSSVSPKFFLAGAAAGILASGIMTPVDVLKTRLATGTCPVDVKSCLLHVIQEEGFVGLYSGAGSRMLFSGAFSAIGFGTFEWAKTVLGVSSPPPPPQPAATPKKRAPLKSSLSSKMKNKSIAHICDQKELTATEIGTLEKSSPV